jgi:hypothetical protein
MHDYYSFFSCLIMKVSTIILFNSKFKKLSEMLVFYSIIVKLVFYNIPLWDITI